MSKVEVGIIRAGENKMPWELSTEIANTYTVTCSVKVPYKH